MDEFQSQLYQLAEHCFDVYYDYVDVDVRNMFVAPFYEVLRQIGIKHLVGVEFESAGDFVMVNFKDGTDHFVLFERGVMVDFCAPCEIDNKDFSNLIWEMGILERGHRIFGCEDYLMELHNLPNVDWSVLDLLERSCKLRREIDNFLKMTTRME